MRLIVIIAILLLALPVLAYDQHKGTIQTEDKGHFTYPRVEVAGTAIGYIYKDGYQKRRTFFYQTGSGVVIKKGYVLTAAHIVVPQMVRTMQHKHINRVTRPFKVLKRIVLLKTYDGSQPIIADVYYIDHELDFAILKYEPIGILKPIPYEIECRPGLLRVGDAVCVVTHRREKNQRVADIRFEYGTIKFLGPELPRNTPRRLAWFNPFDITIDCPVLPGDSGSPVFAFKGGRPVLIGIIRAHHRDGRSSYTYFVLLPNLDRIM